jgi:hypothetical protein
MGGGLYPCDTTIIVKGISNEGYTFVNWTDSLGRIISTDSIYSVNIFDNNINLIANFKRINTFDVKLTARPIIGGSVFGSGQFKKDTIITITAIPNFGYAFNGWLDISWILEIGVSNAPNYTFQVTKDINLVADFVLGNKLTLNLNYPNGGIVTGSGYYAPNNYAEVRATANDCYNFLNWTENGNIYSTNSTEWIRMSTDRTLVANFVPKRYNISLSAYPTSGGSVVGSGNFPCDSLVFVRANPKTGYKFINWTENGNIVSTDSSYSFIVKKQRSLNANFSLITDIKQTEINKIVNVYPNPVRHILQVDLLSLQSSKITLNIIDINGNVLLTKTLFNAKGEINTSFDVSKLAKGNYILNLFDEDGMANYRFVVQ